MATFVSLATCHHCSLVSSRRGLVYRDSLSALSRNLRGPHHWGPRPQGLSSKHHCRLTRPHLPESIALARSQSCGSVKRLMMTHLRKLLPLSPSHR